MSSMLIRHTDISALSSLSAEITSGHYAADKPLARPDILSKYVETVGCNIAHNKNL